jgi:SSS family solute:Na+ symporter
MGIRWDEMGVFIVLFVLVTVLGFLAARWRRGDLGELSEWGLGGRRFGTAITWFLLGGDLYTAYTFIAVPGLVYGQGALGFYALPYVILAYPLVYPLLSRLWSVGHGRGYITPSDWVADRFGSRTLALLVAVTGIVATMPYIALQMYGIEVVLGAMGVPVELALIVAFAVLAVFTFVSGLRAPALIAIVKDTLIWVAVLVAVIYIPYHLGGFGHIFAHVPAAKLTLAPSQYSSFASLALGSALALFLYPHAITSTFSARSRTTVERNTALLPLYSLLLGLIAMLGYVAIAAGVHPPAAYGKNGALPALFAQVFPGWFTGFAYAAIAIGALVPASVMSIAAANLFSRNIWVPYLHRAADTREQSRVSKIASLLVKAGAVAFILIAPTTYIINFQLAGGVWILRRSRPCSSRCTCPGCTAGP